MGTDHAVVERRRSKGVLLAILLLPLLFAAVQVWASRAVTDNLQPAPIVDGTTYLTQGRDWLVRHHERASFISEFGLYPIFLSHFGAPNIADAQRASIDPRLLPIYRAQTWVLAGATALLLVASMLFAPGSAATKIGATALVGVLLLGPLVIVWPSSILTESLSLSALLLFVAACLACDAGKRLSLLLVIVCCCLLVLIRDPMIFFVWILFGLLGLNLLASRRGSAVARVAIVAVLVGGAALGVVRASFLSASGKYIQTFVNIIQFRMLPEPERRAFFVEHGLVLSPAVVDRIGKPAWQDGTLWKPDDQVTPDFRDYRNWVVAHGIRTYAGFLLTHPGYLLRSLVASPNLSTIDYGWDFHLSITDVFWRPLQGYWSDVSPYPQWLADFLSAPLRLLPLGWLLPVLYLAVVVVRYGIGLITRRRSSLIEMAAIAAGTSIFVSYHTDAWDLFRHSLPFVLLIYIAMIVRSPVIAAEVLAWARARPKPAVVPASA